MAKMMMANSKSRAMFTSGPIALPMADITTWRPEKNEKHKLSDRDGDAEDQLQVLEKFPNHCSLPNPSFGLRAQIQHELRCLAELPILEVPKAATSDDPSALNIFGLIYKCSTIVNYDYGVQDWTVA